MRIRLWAAFILMAAVLSGVAYTTMAAGSGPDTGDRVFSYQGHLRQDGELVDGTFTLTFILTNAVSAPTQSWSDTLADVQIHNGAFSVLVGSGTHTEPIPSWVFVEPQVFVQIEVDGTRLSGHQRVVPTPYAYWSAESDDLLVRGSLAVAGPLSTTDDIDAGGRLREQGALAVPVGTVLPFAGNTAPPGWRLCDGATLDAATFPDLFAVIATTYGSAGAGTFRLPDLRGRAVVGAGTGAGLTARALGASFGTETHQLTVAEMPAHTHQYTTIPAGDNRFFNPGGGSHYMAPQVAQTTSSAGSDQAHNTMQPSLALSYIIKY